MPTANVRTFPFRPDQTTLPGRLPLPNLQVYKPSGAVRRVIIHHASRPGPAGPFFLDSRPTRRLPRQPTSTMHGSTRRSPEPPAARNAYVAVRRRGTARILPIHRRDYVGGSTGAPDARTLGLAFAVVLDRPCNSGSSRNGQSQRGDGTVGVIRGGGRGREPVEMGSSQLRLPTGDASWASIGRARLTTQPARNAPLRRHPHIRVRSLHSERATPSSAPVSEHEHACPNTS